MRLVVQGVEPAQGVEKGRQETLGCTVATPLVLPSTAAARVVAAVAAAVVAVAAAAITVRPAKMVSSKVS
jgi:hypothetical protein